MFQAVKLCSCYPISDSILRHAWISKQEEAQPAPPAPPAPQLPPSPMGEACSRMDLTAIHQILVMTHYRDDEGTNEVKLTGSIDCLVR